MKRYDRPRFVAFGLLTTLNILGLALYGLEISTGSNPKGSANVPFLLVLMALCLPQALLATVRRGRDVAWHPGITLLAFWVSLGFGPVILGVVGYLAFARSRDGAERYGPPAPPIGLSFWLAALLSLAWPWVAVLFARAIP